MPIFIAQFCTRKNGCLPKWRPFLDDVISQGELTAAVRSTLTSQQDLGTGPYKLLTHVLSAHWLNSFVNGMKTTNQHQLNLKIMKFGGDGYSVLFFIVLQFF